MSHTPFTLRSLFRQALRASVIAPLALTGCGPIFPIGYAPPQCENGQLSLQGLTPSVIPDVMQMRSVTSFGRGASGQRAEPISGNSVGTACQTATNAAACQQAFTSLRPTSGFASSCLQVCIDYHIATTQGDTVQAADSLQALKSLLGTIDTAQEAMLVAFANGYSISCSAPDRGGAKRAGTGFDVVGTTGIACGEGTAITRHYLRIAADGTLTEQGKQVIEIGSNNCAIGRRPEGLLSDGACSSSDAVGRFFAEAAHLEAASVPAFEQLAAELKALEAPEALWREALLSALDEIDHTRTTATLARQFGAQPVVPEVRPTQLRSRFELACDNAVEGCVRETFGALVAHYQAAHANDPAVRQAMRQIAEDETRHAELSWAVDAWLSSQLSVVERTAVRMARHAALDSLRAELLAPVDPALVQSSGLPPTDVALALFDSVASSLAS